MKYILFVMFMALATIPSSAEAMQARPALPDRVPGDVDANGAANLSDAIVLLRYLFLGDETYRYEIEQEGRAAARECMGRPTATLWSRKCPPIILGTY